MAVRSGANAVLVTGVKNRKGTPGTDSGRPLIVLFVEGKLKLS